MERLTQTSNSGGVAFTFDLDITCQPSEARKILNLATKLKEYEDLEEQGLLLRLPCKVGDTLYKIIVDKYTKCSLHDKEFSLNCEYCEEKCDSKAIYVIKDFIVFDINEIIFYMKSIGKTVFLTKSEAEAKLKELRGRENG